MIIETILLICSGVLAYVVGAIPSGLLIAWHFGGVDIREHGSGNIGFTNVLRVLGWKIGVPVLIIDILKASGIILILAAINGKGDFSNSLVLGILGMSVMLGNLFNVFMGFKGGKGVATAMGVFLALAPLPILSTLGVFLMIFLISGYVSLASITASVALPICVFYFHGFGILLVFSLIVAVFVIYKHRSNIKRLLTGDEHRFKLFGKS